MTIPPQLRGKSIAWAGVVAAIAVLLLFPWAPLRDGVMLSLAVHLAAILSLALTMRRPTGRLGNLLFGLAIFGVALPGLAALALLGLADLRNLLIWAVAAAGLSWLWHRTSGRNGLVAALLLLLLVVPELALSTLYYLQGRLTWTQAGPGSGPKEEHPPMLYRFEFNEAGTRICYALPHKRQFFQGDLTQPMVPAILTSDDVAAGRLTQDRTRPDRLFAADWHQGLAILDRASCQVLARLDLRRPEDKPLPNQPAWTPDEFRFVGVAHDPSRREILVLRADGTLFAVDQDTLAQKSARKVVERVIPNVVGPREVGFDMQLLPDNNRLLILTLDGFVQLLDRSGKLPDQRRYVGIAHSLEYSQSRDSLFLADVLQGVVRELDARTLEERHQWYVGFGYRYFVLDAAHHSILIANYVDGTIAQLDLQTGQLTRRIVASPRTQWLRVTPDGTQLVWTSVVGVSLLPVQDVLQSEAPAALWFPRYVLQADWLTWTLQQSLLRPADGRWTADVLLRLVIVLLCVGAVRLRTSRERGH